MYSGSTALPTGGVVQQLIGLTAAIRPKYIPGVYTFSVAFGIADVEPDKENMLICTLRDPEGKTIQEESSIALPPIPSNDPLPQEHKGYMVCVPMINTDFTKEGDYRFDITLNGALIESKVIPVYLGGNRS